MHVWGGLACFVCLFVCCYLKPKHHNQFNSSGRGQGWHIHFLLRAFLPFSLDFFNTMTTNYFLTLKRWFSLRKNYIYLKTEMDLPHFSLPVTSLRWVLGESSWSLTWECLLSPIYWGMGHLLPTATSKVPGAAAGRELCVCDGGLIKNRPWAFAFLCIYSSFFQQQNPWFFSGSPNSFHMYFEWDWRTFGSRRGCVCDFFLAKMECCPEYGVWFRDANESWSQEICSAAEISFLLVVNPAEAGIYSAPILPLIIKPTWQWAESGISPQMKLMDSLWPFTEIWAN